MLGVRLGQMPIRDQGPGTKGPGSEGRRKPKKRAGIRMKRRGKKVQNEDEVTWFY